MLENDRFPTADRLRLHHPPGVTTAVRLRQEVGLDPLDLNVIKKKCINHRQIIMTIRQPTHNRFSFYRIFHKFNYWILILIVTHFNVKVYYFNALIKFYSNL